MGLISRSRSQNSGSEQVCVPLRHTLVLSLLYSIGWRTASSPYSASTSNKWLFILDPLLLTFLSSYTYVSLPALASTTTWRHCWRTYTGCEWQSVFSTSSVSWHTDVSMGQHHSIWHNFSRQSPNSNQGRQIFINLTTGRIMHALLYHRWPCLRCRCATCMEQFAWLTTQTVVSY